MPVRLPFGALWIPRNDNLTQPLLAGSFETAEIAFVERFLQPGMNVLDIGAHQGLYTLLSSKRVGSRGRVIAFEPSPRERRALRLHVWLNLCANVTIQALAMGNEVAESDLYVVNGSQTGCNSLRPPDVMSGTSPIRVRVTRLDHWLDQRKIDRVHFIKLDVEGAELDVLKGAERLLEDRPRPVILAEVQDVRTRPWGYRAKEIINQLSGKHFRWFRLSENGSLQDMDENLEELDGNFVAWPEEVELTLPEVQTGSYVRRGENEPSN
jgi:FkbM family methyltransferase